MNHQQIQYNFENNENPSQKEMADAYYSRDVTMNLKFVDQFNSAMKKLNYHPSTYDNFIKFKFRKKMNKIIENFLNGSSQIDNISLVNIKNQIMIEVENTITLYSQRWNQLSIFLENNNHHGFYQAMDISELAFIGY